MRTVRDGGQPEPSPGGDGRHLALSADLETYLFHIPVIHRRVSIHEEPSVGLRELRHHTSEVIARVRRGETIEVTEHGTPVARLVPFERPERPAVLARLEAEGRLRPAKNPGYVPQRLRPVTGADPNPLTGALLEDRESER